MTQAIRITVVGAHPRIPAIFEKQYGGQTYAGGKTYTVVESPGHKDFIMNMITGADFADVALIMVQANRPINTKIKNFARLLAGLGVEQVAIGINHMEKVQYNEGTYNQRKEEAKDMLKTAGWNPDDVAIVPVTGWLKSKTQSTSMSWWKGQQINGFTVKTVDTVLASVFQFPVETKNKPFRMAITHLYNDKTNGNVITGIVEQGEVEKGQEVKLVGSNNAGQNCKGTVVSIHKIAIAGTGVVKTSKASPGDKVGLAIKGIKGFSKHVKQGDVAVASKDSSLGSARTFTAEVQVMDHPSKITVGYSPVGFVRTGRSVVTLKKIVSINGAPTAKNDTNCEIVSGDSAQVEFEVKQHMVCEKYEDCKGLGCVALMDSNSLVMIGKITDVVTFEVNPKTNFSVL